MKLFVFLFKYVLKKASLKKNTNPPWEFYPFYFYFLSDASPDISYWSRVGSVVGTIEGQVDKVNEMKKWLETVGSPKSRIDNVVFSEEKKIDKLNFDSFEIIK